MRMEREYRQGYVQDVAKLLTFFEQHKNILVRQRSARPVRHSDKTVTVEACIDRRRQNAGVRTKLG